jgi:hypothetical protein
MLPKGGIAAVIVTSLAADALGHATLSWGIDAIALTTYLLVIAIGRMGIGLRRVPRP